MTKNEALQVVNRIASADYNGEEECSKADAQRAIKLASRPGHSAVDGAVEAIETLGQPAAVEAYLEQWASDHANEYDDGEES